MTFPAADVGLSHVRGDAEETRQGRLTHVQRDDRPDQAQADDAAPAEIALTLYNQGQIVPDNSGLWATLRETFGEGAGALFGSVKTIGVLVAFITPWLLALAFVAWIARRIYVMRKKR